MQQRLRGNRRNVAVVNGRRSRLSIGAANHAGRSNLRRPNDGICGEIGCSEKRPRQAGCLHGFLQGSEALGELAIAAAVFNSYRGYEDGAADALLAGKRGRQPRCRAARRSQVEFEKTR
jgi:hypothetical protein